MTTSETADSSAHEDSDVDQKLALQRKISQAIDEGHDADIPSAEGYVLTEEEEQRRRESIALSRRKSTASKHSNAAAVAAATGGENRDLEKGTDDTLKGAAGATDTDEDDPNVVWWSENDPEHPYNWPAWRTLSNCVLISAMTFVTPLASSIFAPGVPELMAEFGSSSLLLASFVVSVYILGFAFGPLIMAPLSEIYGRMVVYHACNICFLAFVVGCALAPTLNALIVFRFLSGIFGSCPVTNGGGSIADMIPQERRAAAMAGFSVGPLLGPIIGPIAGGFLAQAKGWRWVFWLLVMIGGALTVVMVLVMKETYHPVILQRKVERLKKETGNNELRSKLDIGLSPMDYFKRGIIRPLKMIVFSPIVLILSVYVAITYGYLYLMFTSMTEVFEEYYGFGTNLVGLSFIGLGVGSLVGVGIFSGTSDKHIQKKAAEADAAAVAAGRPKEGMKPEYRLPTLPIGAVCLPVGLFLYGWTAEYRVHWIVPIIGTGIIGAGNLIIFMCLQLYLVDAFTIYAASAIAANTVVRSVAGAVLPLCGLQMYARLGIGWGNSLLGFISLLLIPSTFLIMKYGETLRKKFVIKNL
ncbi:bicyclomycin resistance protein [Xylariales sp. PMI_506]|nr:bicyclomycin resistance protein [Xylariales sp. PMI_506]